MNELTSRIDELETKQAFQEELIEQLSQSLIAQQNDIRQLTRIIERMDMDLKDMQQPNIVDANQETPPPHY